MLEEINSLLHGFGVVLTPFNFGLMLVGILLQMWLVRKRGVSP